MNPLFESNIPKFFSFLVPALTVLGTLGGTGCGNSHVGTPATALISPVTAIPQSPGVVPVVGCASGAIQIGNGPCLVGTFSQVCVASGGTIRSISGKEVCQVNSDYESVYSGSGVAFISLSPSDPVGSTSYVTGIKLFKEDRLKTSSSGGWGGIDVDYKQYLSGLFSTWNYDADCDEVSVKGEKSGDSVKNKDNGQIAGLWISEGTKAYLAGSSSTHKMENEGLLRFGFNAPSSGLKCFVLKKLRFEISHCQDSTGVSISCH